MNSNLSLFLLCSLAGLSLVAGILFLLRRGRNGRREEGVPRELQAAGKPLTVDEPSAKTVDEPSAKTVGEPAARTADEPSSGTVGEPSPKTGRTGMTYYVYKDAAGEWRWRLLAANNRKIANSGEGYNNKQDCLDAIELVKGSSTAPVKVEG